MYAYSAGINTNWTAVVVHSTGASVMHCVPHGNLKVLPEWTYMFLKLSSLLWQLEIVM